MDWDHSHHFVFPTDSFQDFANGVYDHSGALEDDFDLGFDFFADDASSDAFSDATTPSLESDTPAPDPSEDLQELLDAKDARIVALSEEAIVLTAESRRAISALQTLLTAKTFLINELERREGKSSEEVSVLFSNEFLV